MRTRTLVDLVAVGAFLASLLATEVASAQQVVYVQPGPGQPAAVEEPDGVRFRGGVGLEVGALLLPGLPGGGLGSLGAIGAIGQLGVQINHNWAAYAIPSLDILFGSGTGLGLGFGAMADYTFDGLPLAVAAGPEVGAFAAFGSGGGVGAGALYGVRFRGAYFLTMSQGPRRRKGLYVAVDLRVESLDSLFLFSPLASIGYAAF